MKTSFGAMTGRERLCFVLKYLFMALCVVVALFPIIWVILSSFKTNAEILSNGISPNTVQFPDAGFCNPLMIFSNVVLPTPFSPSSPYIFPPSN